MRPTPPAASWTVPGAAIPARLSPSSTAPEHPHEWACTAGVAAPGTSRHLRVLNWDTQGLDWLRAPILVDANRLACVMVPSDGTLLVQGWEPDWAATMEISVR